MFILSEKNIGCPLSEINKITITYFASNCEILNIYDTNFIFNENLIPLITSILEIEPIIYNYKLYECIDASIIIKENINNIQQNNIQQNNNYYYPSFHYDIDIIENNKGKDKGKNNCKYKNICMQDTKLVSTKIDEDDNQIIRIYNNSPILNDFIQNILYEKEYKKISWEFEFGNFEIIIDLTDKTGKIGNSSKMVKYQININIIEDNKIIISRLNKINDILYKINKIKSTFIINKQEEQEQ